MKPHELNKLMNAIGPELLRSIRRILFWDWDPIGVSGCINTEDEYDDFIPTLHKMLIGGASDAEIAEYIRDAERNQIGLSEVSSPSKLRFVVELLRHAQEFAALEQEANGMTVNERLYAFKKMKHWDQAVRARDQDRMVTVLRSVGYSEEQAAETARAVLNAPARYGY